jgi:ribosomal protein S18 acetylase RimI-like enzyme
MQIRAYQPTDFEPILTVFRKNVPAAFHPTEADEYAGFLRTTTDPYFVAEHQQQLVGACGYYLAQDGQIAHICWILADPDAKGLGVGTALLQHTMDMIWGHSGVQLIHCRTSQVAYGFFEKFGFQRQYTKPDFWAPGLDLYFMTLAIP